MKSRNHRKTQTFAIFVKKNLKIDMLKIKNIVKVGTIFIIHRNIEVRYRGYLLRRKY